MIKCVQRNGWLHTKLALLVMILTLWCAALRSSEAVIFVNYENLYNPATGLYDEFYTPPQLLRPTSSYMAMVAGTPGTNPPPLVGDGGCGGVVVAPNWVLTATHTYINAVGQSVWVDGTEYEIVQQEVAPHESDLSLHRLVAKGSGQTPNLPFVSIDPELQVNTGTAFTIGGFSVQPERNSDGTPTGRYLEKPGILTWGRSYTTDNDGASVKFPNTTSETIPFQGNSAGRDSGGGVFVRDGWNWRLAAITQTNQTAMKVTTTETYNWIVNTLGSTPAINSAARPAGTITWTGGYSDWNTAANWEDAVTHTSRLPELSENRFDAVNITTQNSGPVISTSAAAGQIFVGGTSSGFYTEVTVNAGADLRANTIFIGGDSGDKGLVSIYGGSIHTDTQYVGYRGAVGGVYQEGGVNNSIDVYIGKGNTGAAVYEMAGSSNANSRPILNTKGVEIGGLPGSNGQLLMYASTGPNLEVQTSGQTIVGKRGTGSVTQLAGVHNAGQSLVLGQFTTGSGVYTLASGTLVAGRTQVGVQGSAAFTQSGGTHTADTLSVGAGDSYKISGGSLSTREIQNLGTFEVSGGTIATNVASGVLNFKNSSATLQANGLVNLENSSIINNSTATLSVGAESLVILSSTNTFGTTANLGTLAPHVAGNTLEIHSGGFRGTGLISDEAEMTDGGYASTSGPGGIVFNKGVTVTSTSVAPVTASISTGFSGGVNFYNELIQFNSDEYGNPALETAVGSTLRSGGRYLFDGSTAHMEVNGSLEIGGELGAQNIGRLHIKALNDSQFMLSSTAQLTMNVSREVNSPQQIIADSIRVDLGVASIAGQLRIEELGSFQGLPREQISLITTTPGKLSGHFSSVVVEDGDPSTSGILTKILGEEAAYAVTYTNSGVTARISLPADFNLDDIVDNNDYAIWAANVGLTSATWAQGDADGNGVVNGSDYLIFQRNGLRSWPAVQIVPEPNSCMALLVAFATCVRVKRLRMVRRSRGGV